MVEERDSSDFTDSKRQKVDSRASPSQLPFPSFSHSSSTSPSSSSSRSASSSSSRVDGEADAVFLPHIRWDGSVVFSLRGTSIQVNGDHLDDDDRLVQEHSSISLMVEDEDGEEGAEEEDDGGEDNEEEEAEEGEEVEEEDEEDSGDVDAGGVMEITLTALRRRLATGSRRVVESGRRLRLADGDDDDDGEEDGDYEPGEEDEAEDEDEDEEEEDEEEEEKEGEDGEGEEEEEVGGSPAAVAEVRAEFGRHPRPARWFGAWPIEGVPMTSPEHLDPAAMAAFAQQSRTQSLYADRYPINSFAHTRQRTAPAPNAPSTSPLSSAYLSASFMPTVTTKVTSFDARVFCGRFSSSGSVYCAASQDGFIHLYDTDDDLQLFKRVEARDVGWSVIDVDISHSQRFVIYSSWSDCIQLVNIPLTSPLLLLLL